MVVSLLIMGGLGLFLIVLFGIGAGIGGGIANILNSIPFFGWLLMFVIIFMMLKRKK